MAGNEEDLELVLSGIQHFQFCKRQWALIHIEQRWLEDARTVEGHHLHRKADQPFIREKRGDKLIVRGMPVRSNSLGVTGVCDVVEFVRDDNGVPIRGAEGLYTPYPVEYKRGKPKRHDADVLQLAAQALCLEEMLMCTIDKGYFYYHEIRQRVEVTLDEPLKTRVRSMFEEMKHYYVRRYTPKVKAGPHCRLCSLQSVCLPALMHKRSVKSYVEGKIME